MARPVSIPARGGSSLHQQLAELQHALRLGKSDKAERIWMQIKQAEIPLELATLRLVSALSTRMGESGFALNLWSRACGEFPENIEFLNGAASLLVLMRRYAEARPLIERALAQDPRSGVALLNKGLILLEAHLSTEAMAVLDEAKKIAPRDAQVAINLALAQNFCGYPRLALENAKFASRLDGGDSSIHAVLGSLYAQVGDHKQALATYEKGLRANENSGPCHYGIAELTKFDANHQRTIERMNSLLQRSLEPLDRAFIHMALGKAHDDLGEHDLAFQHFHVGNTLRKPASLPDVHRELRSLDRACAASAVMPPSGATQPAFQPLFIVGMPRSGTTLIEQILARHSDVSTAGELETLSDLVGEIIGVVPSQQEFATRLTAARLDEIRRRYLERLALNRSANASRVIDKSPGNHVFIGLIRLLFPEATIVHTVRHPLDTCLSCYMQAFSSQLWATDLEWIAQHYRHYRESVQAWKTNLVEVHYERVVESPENEVDALLERCGLPADPRCLDPSAGTGEAVRTASSWQVRQPIYRTSVARWIGYAKHLQPLAEGIREYLSEDDYATLAAHGVKLKKGMFSRLHSWLSRTASA